MSQHKEKSLDESRTPAELLAYRRQIDAIDRKLINLLQERSKIVQQVGEYKKSQGHEGCFIRPGREADMLRRIWREFEGGEFSAVAACAMWRQIIAASTSIESDLRVSVYAPEGKNVLYWLAREYFGPFTQVTRHPNCNRVVGDIVANKAEVGLLPPLHVEADWWLTLAQQQNDAPRLFAHVPFVTSKSEASRHASFAIAKVQPEPTESDVGLIAIETTDISINRLITAFTTAGINASRIHYINDTSVTVHNLIQTDTYIDEGDMRLNTIMESLGEGVIGWRVIGSYATPIKTTLTC